MIITAKSDADLSRLGRALTDLGLWAVRFDDSSGCVRFLVQPHSSQPNTELLAALPGVESIATAKSDHPLIEAQSVPMTWAGVEIGPHSAPLLLAGPCSVESWDSIAYLADQLAARGAQFLRGGAFKPRTSPYSFQGHGEKALAWLARAARESGMRSITEALGESSLPLVTEYADVIQIGSRNMANYSLLSAVAQTRKPVLLKRGMSATIEEWLGAGEYLRLHGAPSVVFCERGIRSFDTATRNLLDLSAVALLSHVYRLPIVVDPSHGTGRRDLIPPLSHAAIAAGAHGLLIEVHNQPGEAMSDGPQALTLPEFERLARQLSPPSIRSERS